MTGGKRKLAQLFTSRTKTGADGTWIGKVMSGSVGVVTPACDLLGDGGVCIVSEVTISNLSACSMLIATVEGLSACIRYDGIIAGDGQASVVTRTLGASITGADLDAGTGTVRYIAFDTVA